MNPGTKQAQPRLDFYLRDQMNEWQEERAHSLLNSFYDASKNEWMNKHVKEKKT